MGTGKTYAAMCCAQRVANSQVLSFAAPVKTIARDLFGAITKDRALLQQIGTAMRSIDEDVWVNALLRKIDGNAAAVFVDDLRFENEAIALKKAGFTIVYLVASSEVQRVRLRKKYGEQCALEHDRCKMHASELQGPVRALADIDIYTDYMSSTDMISSLSMAGLLSTHSSSTMSSTDCSSLAKV